MKASSHRSESVSRGAVLHWLDDARAAAHGAPFGELLAIDGVDALEVLMEPLHIALLAALRAGNLDEPGQNLRQSARWVGYRLKKHFQNRRAQLASARPRRVATLFWPREMTHVDAQLPVLASLELAGESCGVLTCQPRTFAGLHARGIEAVFAAGAWPEIARRARRAGSERARRAAAAPPVGLPPFVVQDRAIDVEPLWRRVVCRLLPDVFEAVANAEAAIERFAPQVIVIGNDITLQGRAACLVARKRDVRTAVLMHGNVTGDELHGRHLADATIAYGEAGRREMIRHGGDPARILACGAPYLDQRPRQSGQVDQRLQTQLGIGPTDRWILVATSGAGDRISHGHQQMIIENLFRLAAALPEVHLVIKLHRKDRAVHYQSALQQAAGAKVHVLEHGTPGLPATIFEWLQGCPLVMTGASTVAVEAMLLDVPVITMDFGDEIHHVDFIDGGATLHVTDFPALERAVARVFGSPAELTELREQMHSYLDDAFFQLDGHSAQRTAQAIRALARPATAASNGT